MIASIGFRNFRALRQTQVELRPFNVVIGPNGSGKTSLIEAVLRLRTLAGLAAPGGEARPETKPGRPEIEVRLAAPHDGVVAWLGCVSENFCDSLVLTPENEAARRALQQIRGYVFNNTAMSAPSPREGTTELARDGGNLAAVLARMRECAPDAFSALVEEVLRIMPEFRSVELVEHPDNTVEFALRLAEDGAVPAAELAEGMLHLLGMLVLAFDPDPPRILCIEDVDRGIHPRMLREVRDALYRLSYPESFGRERPATQVIVTTHSPYFIDLFRDHPEEVIISQKHGRAARFERLSDRADLPELLREGSLGEMWYSGILGGVPESSA